MPRATRQRVTGVTVAIGSLVLVLAAAPFLPRGGGDQDAVRPSAADDPALLAHATAGQSAVTAAAEAEIDRVVNQGLTAGSGHQRQPERHTHHRVTGGGPDPVCRLRGPALLPAPGLDRRGPERSGRQRDRPGHPSQQPAVDSPGQRHRRRGHPHHPPGLRAAVARRSGRRRTCRADRGRQGRRQGVADPEPDRGRPATTGLPRPASRDPHAGHGHRHQATKPTVNATSAPTPRSSASSTPTPSAPRDDQVVEATTRSEPRFSADTRWPSKPAPTTADRPRCR